MNKDVAIVEAVQGFVAQAVQPYLRVPGAKDNYPTQLVQRMRELGLFGINVPVAFGGLGLSQLALTAIGVELSKGWLSLAALLGAHMRACNHVLGCATPSQQERYLRRMASGNLVVAYARHEQGVTDPSCFYTVLVRDGPRYTLTGGKPWVTNAKHADALLCIARRKEDDSEAPATVLVFPSRPGVTIGPDLSQPGGRGVSLCQVAFSDYIVQPEQHELIGGIPAYSAGFMGFSEPRPALASGAPVDEEEGDQCSGCKRAYS